MKKLIFTLISKYFHVCFTTKPQVTLDELEDSHDREKKSRLEVDKQRRKVDADLKVSQEKVTDLEREKHDIEAAIVKKDQDIVVSQRRLEDEQSIVAKAQKAIKELQSRIETSEEELEAERQARSKSEKQRGTLARELDDLAERLDEVELNVPNPRNHLMIQLCCRLEAQLLPNWNSTKSERLKSTSTSPQMKLAMFCSPKTLNSHL